MLHSSADYYDLLIIYCGPEPRRLPPELCMICLELAGLCGRRGRRCAFFWVYS